MVLFFGTKLRKKLLAYSFAHPDEDYYVREMASFIQEDPGNLSREFRHLEKEGLYLSKERGHSKFYTLNKSYPLFGELKTMVSKTIGVAGSLNRLLQNHPEIQIAFIYGSYAREEESMTSDIDVIIVGDFDTSKLTHQIRQLERQCNREINFTSLTLEEFQNKKKEGFLSEVLKGEIYGLKGDVNAFRTDQKFGKRR